MRNSIIKRLIRNLIKYLITSIVILLVTYNLVYVIGSQTNNLFNIKFFGFGCFVISDQSMEPELEKNDLIFIKETSQINKGDIILVKQNNRFKVRRVTKVNIENYEKMYVIKGDNCLYNDPEEVKVNQIEGKIIKKIDSLGILVKIIQSKWLMLFNTLIFVAMFLRNKKIEERKRIRTKTRRKMEQNKNNR